MREGKADSMSVQPWLCCWRQNGQKAITRNTGLHDKAAKSAICRVAMSFVCFSSIYLLFFGMKKEAQLFSQAPVGSSSFLRHDTKIPPVVSFGRYFV